MWVFFSGIPIALLWRVRFSRVVSRLSVWLTSCHRLLLYVAVGFKSKLRRSMGGFMFIPQGWNAKARL